MHSFLKCNLTNHIVYLLASLFVLQGPPSPAMWDGILPITVPSASSPIVLKGRDANGYAEADGATPLPEECFVAMNRFSVRADSAEAFERRWAERESNLQVRFGLARCRCTRTAQSSLTMSDLIPVPLVMNRHRPLPCPPDAFSL